MTACRLAHATGHDPRDVLAWPADMQAAMMLVLRDIADPQTAQFRDMITEVEEIQRAG